MIDTSKPTMLAGLGLIFLTLGLGPASARIVCLDGFQRVQGALLSTPYCQDDLVAAVARAYGMKASADAVRQNPNFKRYLCLFVGHDIRIKQSCQEVNPTGRSGF